MALSTKTLVPRILSSDTRQGSPRLSDLSANRRWNCSFKGGFAKCAPSERRDYIRRHRSCGMSVVRGCQLMGIARSTYYREPVQRLDDAELLVGITAISD